MSDQLVQNAQQWVREVAGDEAFREREAAWTAFERQTLPVVTLFGAYDTGKSAIVRRLLVDAGRQVPEWVTISARHETFEAGQVEMAGFVLQDSPGVSDREDDLRAVNNTRAAMRAVGLSDVVCIVVPSQLPTGERDLLLRILDQNWPTGSLRLIISKFDEAGGSPLYDLEGYKELAERKIAELRASLSLSADAPVHVVIPDFEQIAGSTPSPDASVWDESRPFDGMAQLAAALGEVRGDRLPEFRAAAATRYWLDQVGAFLEDATAELADLELALREAQILDKRRDLFLQELQSLDEAARVSIRGAAEEAIRSTMRRQSVDAKAIKSAVDQVLEQWWLRECAGLDRLLREAGAALDDQRERPGWHLLAEVFEPEPDEATRPRLFTPKAEKVAEKAKTAADTIKNLKEAANKNTRRPAADAAAGAAGTPPIPKIEIAAAALPVILELMGHLEDAWLEKKAKEARAERREQLNRDVTRIAHDAADQAIVAWDAQVEATRAAIGELTGLTSDDLAALTAQAEEARQLVSRGEEISAR